MGTEVFQIPLVEIVTGVYTESFQGGTFCGFDVGLQYFVASGGVECCGVFFGIEFYSVCVDVGGANHVFGFGVHEEADADTGVSKSRDDGNEPFTFFFEVPSVV